MITRGGAAPFRIAGLLTCHNRKDKTLKCIEALFAQALPAGCELSVYLVDDGSTDGTAEAVMRRFPEVYLIQGAGDLYWNGGMRVAFDAATDCGYNGYLWVNDDTVLDDGAVRLLMDTLWEVAARVNRRSVVVGSIRDPDTGGHTYGGVVRASRWHPLKFRPVEPADVPVRCATMNGNCVLIPSEVAERVGNLDQAFPHAIGDLDYGLRATRADCQVWVAPGYVGWCRRNPEDSTWVDARLPLVERWRKVRHPKGLPLGAWKVFARRHAGPLWPVYWLMPYVRLLVTSVARFSMKASGDRTHTG